MMGGCALKVGVLIFFSIVVLERASSTEMSVNDWVECWRIVLDPSRADPRRVAYCYDLGRVIFHGGSAKVPRAYREALQVIYNGNQTQVDEYICALSGIHN